MQTLAIIGASLAGLSAARAARAQGFTGRLVIIGAETHRPYDRPPLSKDFLAGRIGADDLFLEAGEETDGLDAQWFLGVRAYSFDAATRTITLADGTVVVADKVVLATGAAARTLPEIAGAPNVFTLRSLDDARALGARLVAGARLVVIGAGFIGAEVASTAKTLGASVTVIERAATPLSGPLGATMGAIISGLHSFNDVELLCDTAVTSFTYTGTEVSGVVLDSGRVLAADVVLVGIGAIPNIGWLTGSGLELGNGVICDSMGRTNTAGVVAVGDCAAWFDLRSGTHRRVEHWTEASQRAAIAVSALLTEALVPAPANAPYFWSDQYGSRVQFAGDAGAADRVEILEGDPGNQSFVAVYYDGPEPVAVLGMNQVRLFTKWRKSLHRTTTTPVPVPAPVPAQLVPAQSVPA